MLISGPGARWKCFFIACSLSNGLALLPHAARRVNDMNQITVAVPLLEQEALQGDVELSLVQRAAGALTVHERAPDGHKGYLAAVSMLQRPTHRRQVPNPVLHSAVDQRSDNAADRRTDAASKSSASLNIAPGAGAQVALPHVDYRPAAEAAVHSEPLTFIQAAKAEAAKQVAAKEGAVKAVSTLQFNSAEAKAVVQAPAFSVDAGHATPQPVAKQALVWQRLINSLNLRTSLLGTPSPPVEASYDSKLKSMKNGKDSSMDHSSKHSKRKDRPYGSDIWNSSWNWPNETVQHPPGLTTNIADGEPQWATVSYQSLYIMLLLSVLAYPAAQLLLLVIITLVVSMCFTMKNGNGSDEAPSLTEVPGSRRDDVVLEPAVPNQPAVADPESCPEESPEVTQPQVHREAVERPQETEEQPCRFTDFGREAPLLPRDQLTPTSLKAYEHWFNFCRAIPCLLVVVTPIVLLSFSWPYPQEVFSILRVVTSVLMVSNAIHLVLFCTSSINMVVEAERKSAAPGGLWPGILEDENRPDVMHWVICPQYKEDLEVTSLALASISQSVIARSHIGIVLAMESREVEAPSKVATIRQEFEDKFAGIVVSYHPPNLPNDPPGKASNVAWAFGELMRYLKKTSQDMSKIVLTIADADSEFHKAYFVALTQQFLNHDEESRYKRIWQAPCFHTKNYHRQPMIVTVGTMFQLMQDLASLSDPNAIVFPYSTYSLSLELARCVHGWDPDWIAEDWHMGMKCFLMTLGNCTTETIPFPTLNYTPEESTWSKTLLARWSQAKRHALGFSDLSYWFMVIPLLYNYIVAGARKGKGHCQWSLGDFWSMLMRGIPVLVKFINIHVLLGVFATYGLMSIILKLVMQFAFADDREVSIFFDRSSDSLYLMAIPVCLSTLIVSALFVWVYENIKPRVEFDQGIAPLKYRYQALHWLAAATSLTLFGFFWFVALGFAAWRAAFTMLFSHHFEYEVASKPTKENRL